MPSFRDPADSASATFMWLPKSHWSPVERENARPVFNKEAQGYLCHVHSQSTGESSHGHTWGMLSQRPLPTGENRCG